MSMFARNPQTGKIVEMPEDEMRRWLKGDNLWIILSDEEAKALSSEKKVLKPKASKATKATKA